MNAKKTITTKPVVKPTVPSYYIPYKIKCETPENGGANYAKERLIHSLNFSVVLADQSIDKLVLMMRSEVMKIKDYVEGMSDSLSSLLTKAQILQLKTEHANSSGPTEILQIAQHQLDLTVSKQLETLDEFDQLLDDKQTNNTINLMQDLCSVITTQHGIMRSYHWKFPFPASDDLEKIIFALETIAAHLFLNIPMLNVTTTQRDAHNVSMMSPTKNMIKKIGVRHLNFVNSASVGKITPLVVQPSTPTTTPNKGSVTALSSASFVGAQNEIFINEDNLDKRMDNVSNSLEAEEDVLMLDAQELEIVNKDIIRPRVSRFSGNKCRYRRCGVNITKGDIHPNCIPHSKCFIDQRFDPSRCSICKGIFEKVKLDDPLSKKLWHMRTKNFRKQLSRTKTRLKNSIWFSKDIKKRFSLAIVPKGDKEQEGKNVDSDGISEDDDDENWEAFVNADNVEADTIPKNPPTKESLLPNEKQNGLTLNSVVQQKSDESALSIGAPKDADITTNATSSENTTNSTSDLVNNHQTKDKTASNISVDGSICLEKGERDEIGIWLSIITCIDEFFGRPSASLIPFMLMAIYTTKLSSAFGKEILVLILELLHVEIISCHSSIMLQTNKDQSRFLTCHNEKNIQLKLSSFMKNVVNILVKHDIPVSHLESYVLPLVVGVCTAFWKLADQNELTLSQINFRSDNRQGIMGKESPFNEDVKNLLRNTKLIVGALQPLQKEVIAMMHGKTRMSTATKQEPLPSESEINESAIPIKKHQTYLPAQKQQQMKNHCRNSKSQREFELKKLLTNIVQECQSSGVSPVKPASYIQKRQNAERQKSSDNSIQSKSSGAKIDADDVIDSHQSTVHYDSIVGGQKRKLDCDEGSPARDGSNLNSKYSKNSKNTTPTNFRFILPKPDCYVVQILKRRREFMEQESPLSPIDELPSLTESGVDDDELELQPESEQKDNVQNSTSVQTKANNVELHSKPNDAAPQTGLQQKLIIIKEHSVYRCVPLKQNASSNVNQVPAVVSKSSENDIIVENDAHVLVINELPLENTSVTKENVCNKQTSSISSANIDCSSVNGSENAGKQGNTNVAKQSGYSASSSITKAIPNGNHKRSVNFSPSGTFGLGVKSSCSIVSSNNNNFNTLSNSICVKNNNKSNADNSSINAKNLNNKDVRNNNNNNASSNNDNNKRKSSTDSISESDHNVKKDSVGKNGVSSDGGVGSDSSSNSGRRRNSVDNSGVGNSRSNSFACHDDAEEAVESDANPGPVWFKAPVQALFKMIDNEFVMRFHGNMYKSPEISLRFFNKKMWFKVNLNCAKTLQLLKYVQSTSKQKDQKEDLDVLRLDLFKRFAQILSNTFTPTARVAPKKFCSIEIDHFPSQIQHLLYKLGNRDHKPKDISQDGNADEMEEFEMETFIKKNWIYDLCSKDEETEKFFKYLNQEEPKINSYSPSFNKDEAFDTVKEEEKLSRKRLMMMSSILCGQELITDILSKLNSQIDQTSVPQSINKSSLSVRSTSSDSQQNSATIKSNVISSVDRNLKETLIRLEQFHRGIETQSSTLAAILMEEASTVKRKWREQILCNDHSLISRRLLNSNVFTPDVFDDGVIDSITKELRTKLNKTNVNKDVDSSDSSSRSPSQD